MIEKILESFAILVRYKRISNLFLDYELQQEGNNVFRVFLNETFEKSGAALFSTTKLSKSYVGTAFVYVVFLVLLKKIKKKI